MREKDEIRISFIGDIMCDKPLMKAAHIGRNEYDFSPVFREMTSRFHDSDYVIGNLETVCAGNQKREYMLCNAPDEIVHAIKTSGISMLVTANNHCLDYGVEGLIRTLDLLDENGIEHTGTFRDKKDSNTIFVKKFGDLKIAFLSYTYSVNETNIENEVLDNSFYHINFLKPPMGKRIIDKYSGVKRYVYRITNAKQRRLINRIIARTKLAMGFSFVKPWTDVLREEDIDNNALIKLKAQIKNAKEVADFVVVCPHFGGQFNEAPGKCTEYYMDYLMDCGADAVIGHHPHIVQKAFVQENAIGAFSVGGFNISRSAEYVVHESLPEYSLLMSLWFERTRKQLSRVAFSILKAVEDSNKMITVYPVEVLLQTLTDNEQISALREDVTRIFNRVMQVDNKSVDIKKEYILYERANE